MGENTKIEWAHHTFNPWVGCTKVGPGCDNCYAEVWAKRSGMVQWGPPHAERRRTSERYWRQPIKWNAEAERIGVRYRVFCSSLADVFDNAVPNTWRWDLFRTIAATPHLDWMLLTKRIGNAREMLNSAASAVANDFVGIASWDREPWPNIWIGATICNQEEADRDIPKLLDLPAEKRFLSIEPLLGPVDLRHLNDGKEVNEIDSLNPWTWEQEIDTWRGTCDTWELDFADYYGVLEVKDAKGPCHNKIDWVIAGGESGPKARPMHPDWPRSLRDQCAAANVPFLFKQWGEWEVSSEKYHRGSRLPDTSGRYTWISPSAQTDNRSAPEDNCYAMERVGKMKAGRLLDGVEHNAYPERAP